MQNDICQAIEKRRVISFSYKSGERTVEPHMVAFSKTGKLVLSAWFLQGGSESKEGPGWRTYALDEMSRLTVSSKTFSGPRPDYQADGGRSFRRIQCAL
ncbi:MAG: WYL domain-containing protein [Burkholderiales bacterium]|nr:WYL domain-containing protein [Burkholderiales bacterium]